MLKQLRLGRLTLVTGVLALQVLRVDGATPVHLEPVGRYESGSVGTGSAEIVAHHAPTRQLYSVNTDKNEIDILSIADPRHPVLVSRMDLAEIGSAPTSVAAAEDVIAASVLATDPRQPGKVVFFRPNGERLGVINVGFHPDMVMFSADGKTLVVANEGEPSADGEFDGEGSVSVISIPQPMTNDMSQVKVRDAGFQRWNDGGEAFPPGARRVDPQHSVAQDFEPEGIAISTDGQLAYVTLQESNAVAVINLATAQVDRILGLGYKDHQRTGHELDMHGLGKPDSMQTCQAKGFYQPDNIGYVHTARGTYLLLANEGDARANAKFTEEILLKDAKLDAVAFPNAGTIQLPTELGSLFVSLSGDTDHDGDLDELHLFGGRSLSIVADDGKCVYDSGPAIEAHVIARLERERAAHADKTTSYRTKKGPEPEGLAVAHLDDHIYAFVGLERDNGIVTFDVTDPTQPAIVDYINPAELAGPANITADIAPEGLCFIEAKDNALHEPLLAVANEVSGSITLYAIRSGARAGAQK